MFRKIGMVLLLSAAAACETTGGNAEFTGIAIPEGLNAALTKTQDGSAASILFSGHDFLADPDTADQALVRVPILATVLASCDDAKLYYAVRGFSATEIGATATGELNVSTQPPAVLFDLESTGESVEFTVEDTITLAATPRSPMEVMFELILRASPESERNRWNISVDSLDLALSCPDHSVGNGEE